MDRLEGIYARWEQTIRFHPDNQTTMDVAYLLKRCEAAEAVLQWELDRVQGKLVKDSEWAVRLRTWQQAKAGQEAADAH